MYTSGHDKDIKQKYIVYTREIGSNLNEVYVYGKGDNKGSWQRFPTNLDVKIKKNKYIYT